MPQQLARGGGQRWSEIYYGSSVIALNTAPDFLKNQQNNKRVIFLKLTQSIEEMFTSEELNHLHNLEPKHILGYVNSEPTKLFKWRNDWSGVIEDLKEDVKQHISIGSRSMLLDTDKHIKNAFLGMELKGLWIGLGLWVQTIAFNTINNLLDLVIRDKNNNNVFEIMVLS